MGEYQNDRLLRILPVNLYISSSSSIIKTKNKIWEKSYFIFYDFTTNGCRQQGHSAFRLLSIHELIHVS